jgi:hypothetical protein
VTGARPFEAVAAFQAQPAVRNGILGAGDWRAESALFILSLAKPLDQVDKGLEEVRPFGLDM